MEKIHRFKGLKRKELKMLIKQHEASINSLVNDIEVIKARETKWKQQRDAEEYYKKQAEEKAIRAEIKVVKLEQEIEKLRNAYNRSLNALQGEAVENRQKDEKIEELEKHCRSIEAANSTLNKALDSVGSNKITYIGQMPGSLVMGNAGQLVEKPNKDNAGVGHYPFDEEGHVPFDEPTNGVSNKPADVDEAVEWAKRNGHHFPEGKPEKDRMESVVVKSADEISEENRKKAEDTLGFVG